MKRFSVFFQQKIYHRERQKETYTIASTLCNASSSIFNISSPWNIGIESSLKGFSWKKIIVFLLKYIPIINIRKITPSDIDTDYIYTWGDIPLFPQKRYIVELDNPYILTLYNTFAFRIYQPIIKRLLLSGKCHKIVCISEACRESLGDLLGEKVKEKAIVLYPYVQERQNLQNDPNIVHFGFVGLRIMGKGCLELLEAFHKRKEENIILHIVGFRNHTIEQYYQDDSRIIFHWPKERKDILENILPTWDVFVFPTLFESLGMAALEAVSCWLWIITTDVFALPEICSDGYNGRLLPHPFLNKEKVWNKEIVNVIKYNGFRFAKKFHITEGSYNKDLEVSIFHAITEAIEKKDIWKQHSVELYERRFSEKIWKDTFISLLK